MKRTLFIVTLLALLAVGYYGVTYTSMRGQDEFVRVEITPEPPKELPPDVVEKHAAFVKEQVAQMEKSSTLFDVSGPTTAGSIIMVAGKEVQLPKDVMVEALLISSMCVEGRHCPEMPQYILLYTDASGDKIGVSANSGAIDNFHAQYDAEFGLRIQERFTWLYDTLGVVKPEVKQ